MEPKEHRKRTDLSLKEKLNLIERYDNLGKISQRNAAALLGISQPLLCKILKNRNELVRKSNENEFMDRKRNRKGKDASVEKALKVWVTNVRKQYPDEPLMFVDGPLMQQKAEELAAKMGKKDFVATSGWFNRWKKRENIAYKSVHRETKDSDLQAAERWISEEWPKLRDEYAPENVYNADETGLYFRAMPEHTHLFESEHAKGHQIVKEHITVLCCMNMVGDKKRLLVIGKNKSPPCFKNVKKLPVDYFSNDSAWMTADIFNEWLLKWDEALTKNVLLLIDNCTAHTVNVTLKHITIVFLPASLTQPLDQGIIHACKVHYRNEMRARISEVTKGACAEDLAKETSLLETLHLLNMAWEKVTVDTIKHGFSRGGFSRNDSEDNVVSMESDKEWPEDLEAEDFKTWMSIDADIQVSAALTESGVCERFSPEEENPNDQMDEKTLNPEEEGDNPPPTDIEMRNALHVLRRGVMQYSDSFTELYRFEDFMNGLLRKKDRQITLNEFVLWCNK